MSQRSQISITVQGVDVALSLRPIGVDLNYTYNEVPVALVDISTDDISLLCNFENFRRKKVIISINTDYGCIKFEGLIDGLSMVQSIGNIRLQMVVKNSFQVLKETYPKLPGLHPSSMDLFRRVDVIKHSPEFDDFFKTLSIGLDTRSDRVKNLIDFYIAAAIKYVTAQQNITVVSNVAPAVSGIIQVAKDLAKTTLPIALDKLGKIDTSFVKGMTISAASALVTGHALEGLVNGTDSLFNSLVSNLTDLGCVLVIGNSKAWVVPEVGFLQIDHTSKIGLGATSDLSNIVYPAQYTSVTFNDNGYRDIKACYVVSDANIQLLNKKLTSELGFYIDTNAKGGVLTLAIPKFVAVGSAGALFEATSEAQKAIKEKSDNLSEELDEDTTVDELKDVESQLELNGVRSQKEFINNWAQLKYLQAKYMDRLGSISMKFNPKWAPAAVGSLYTRHPGTYIDFFVTSISHRFSLNAPNSGTAETIVNFNCGRIGKDALGSGIDKIILYDYDAARSLAFAESFVVNNALLSSAANSNGFE